MTQAETVTELTPYLEYWSSGIYMFKCPGCKYLHPFHVKTEQSTKVETITREVQKIIERPVYKSSCIDDGLRVINSLNTDDSS